MTEQPSVQETVEAEVVEAGGAEEAESTAVAEEEASGGPVPLGITLQPTGNAEVDALLDRLGDADDLPTEGHIEVYEDVHRGLRDTLTALDSRPGPPGPNQRHEDRS
ncbi:hypothetical protein ACWGCW_08555 [Streptomyces sp. NPDC054933]